MAWAGSSLAALAGGLLSECGARVHERLGGADDRQLRRLGFGFGFG